MSEYIEIEEEEVREALLDDDFRAGVASLIHLFSNGSSAFDWLEFNVAFHLVEFRAELQAEAKLDLDKLRTWMQRQIVFAPPTDQGGYKDACQDILKYIAEEQDHERD